MSKVKTMTKEAKSSAEIAERTGTNVDEIRKAFEAVRIIREDDDE